MAYSYEVELQLDGGSIRVTVTSAHPMGNDELLERACEGVAEQLKSADIGEVWPE